MTIQNNVQVTIALQAPDLNEEELQEAGENLRQQLLEVDGVEQANLVAVAAPPSGAKALGGFIPGLLMAEVSPRSIKALFRFLGDRLGNKPVEMEVEANGRKLKVKASSREELMAAIQAAHAFVEA